MWVNEYGKGFFMATADRVSEIFADARSVHVDALRLLAVGDIRDAA